MNLSFIQLSGFIRDCRRLGIDDEALQELEQQLLQRPDAGTVVAGTGGLRKIRFAPKQWKQGKSGSTRVCYAFFRMASQVYFVKVFGKNEQENLTPLEKSAIRSLLTDIERSLRGRYS